MVLHPFLSWKTKKRKWSYEGHGKRRSPSEGGWFWGWFFFKSLYNTTWPHVFWKIFVNFLTSRLLRTQNTVLLSKVQQTFFFKVCGLLCKPKFYQENNLTFQLCFPFYGIFPTKNVLKLTFVSFQLQLLAPAMCDDHK